MLEHSAMESKHLRGVELRSIAGLLCLFLIACKAIFAQSQPSTPLTPAWTEQVNVAILRALAESGTPSASVAIVLNGKLAYAGAFGKANLSSGAPATPETRYQLASISKSITANALLLLEQDGKLSLSDPVSRYLPGLTHADRVTVRELLEHTAGYPEHYPQTYPAGPRTSPTTPDQIIAEWGHHPLLFPPGSEFHYSNLNYVIAGRIAEKVANEPLFPFIQRRIFGPLGMTSTINLDEITSTNPDIAVGYVRPALASLQPAPAEGRGWSFGAGLVVTTATDLARWDEAFLAGKLLASKQALEEVSTPVLANGNRSDYALGLSVSKAGGRTTYSHVGQGLGFLAVNRLYPSEHAAIVVLTNDSSALTFSHIADRIEYLVVPPSQQEVGARVMFASVQKGSPDRSRFSKDLNEYFDARMVQQYMDSLGPLGEPESFALRSKSEADGIATVVYDIVAGGHRLRLIEQMLSDGMIESYQIQEAAR